MSGVMARIERQSRDGYWPHGEKPVGKAPGAAVYRRWNCRGKPDTLLSPQTDVQRFYDAGWQRLNGRHSLVSGVNLGARSRFTRSCKSGFRIRLPPLATRYDTPHLRLFQKNVFEIAAVLSEAENP
jgi:hypothetical protein